jgi:ribonuclease HI
MYFDGSLNLEGEGANLLKYVLQVHYKASNNGIEYDTLIHGLHIAVSVGIKRLISYGDSKVVIDQVNKVCEIKKDSMNAYYAEVRKLKAHFEGLEFHHVCHDNNVAADVLSKLGSKRSLVPVGVFVQDLRKPSIRLLNDPEMSLGNMPPTGCRNVLMTEVEDDWRLDFIAYILEKHVPEDKVEREKILRRSANYIVIRTELYRRSASNSVLMKCILRSEGLQLLQRDPQRGMRQPCNLRKPVGKAFWSGFYCPTALADAQDLVR